MAAVAKALLEIVPQVARVVTGLRVRSTVGGNADLAVFVLSGGESFERAVEMLQRRFVLDCLELAGLDRWGVRTQYKALGISCGFL